MEILDHIVVAPLKPVQGLFAAAQHVTQGAGGGRAEWAFWVNDPLPLGQVVRGGQAVGRGSCRPSHHPLRDSKNETLPWDVLLLLCQQACNGALAFHLVSLLVGVLQVELLDDVFSCLLYLLSLKFPGGWILAIFGRWYCHIFADRGEQ